jgi:hypothetical protein
MPASDQCIADARSLNIVQVPTPALQVISMLLTDIQQHERREPLSVYSGSEWGTI